MVPIAFLRLAPSAGIRRGDLPRRSKPSRVQKTRVTAHPRAVGPRPWQYTVTVVVPESPVRPTASKIIAAVRKMVATKSKHRARLDDCMAWLAAAHKPRLSAVYI